MCMLYMCQSGFAAHAVYVRLGVCVKDIVTQNVSTLGPLAVEGLCSKLVYY
jgi:hypothetical protein